MRVAPTESVTLAVAGAEVTLSAGAIADLWIKKVMAESRADAPAAQAASHPPLKEGETYVGMIAYPDGTRRHIILLPQEHDAINYHDALAWAADLGGDLPDRVEQALMFATLRAQFKEAWYWSNTQHAASYSYAWCQHFGDGYHYDYDSYYELRARAVRRVIE